MRERSSASPSERLDIASFRHLRLRRGWPASAWRSPQPPKAVAEGQARQTLAGQPPPAPPATSQRCGPATRWRATEIPHPAIEPSNSPRSRRQNRPKIRQPTLDNPDSRSSGPSGHLPPQGGKGIYGAARHATPFGISALIAASSCGSSPLSHAVGSEGTEMSGAISAFSNSLPPISRSGNCGRP
jgi:hypothetical protein